MANFINLKSPGTYSFIHLCYTFTATISPVDFSFALWTYPNEALAIGFSSNSENIFSNFYPNSNSTISFISLYLVLGALISIGSKDLMY